MSDPKNPFQWAARLTTVWRSAGMGFPVDVSLLALDYTARCFDDPIKKVKGHDVAGIEGMLIKREAKGGWYLLFDQTVEVKGRINFTLGHELGHYLLHRFMRDEFQCGQSALLDYDSPEARKLEGEANKFASYLLMPIDDFRQQVDGHNVTLDLIGHCADRYQTSFTAAALKWLEFTEECALLVVARDGFVCWSYSSKSARKLGIYLGAGSPVPADAEARSRKAAGASSRNQSQRVGPMVWHATMEAEESTILSDKFDLSIFLVRFPRATSPDHDEEPERDMFDVFSARAEKWS